jgi:hypothetical protein
MLEINLLPLEEFFPATPVYARIPPGMATNETWMLYGRKAIAKSPPVAFFRPQDFSPEPFGYQQGIPLYRYDQTRSYHPQPETVAAQQYYDFFVASQNRHRHSRWADRPHVKPGWRTHDQYLSRAKIREHLWGKEIYGCWGDLWTNWFAIDVDYHGGDPEPFLAVLEILKELPDFFPWVRWVYILNRNGISGLHIVGLLPAPRLLEDVRRDVQKVLAYLGDEKGVDLANLEIYPATNHNFRLPYAADRITVTDEWLNQPGDVDLKPNLVRFMAYVRDQDRQAVPLDEVIAYIGANVQWKPAKRKKSQGTRKHRGGGNGMGKIEPLKGRHLTFLTGVVLGTEAMPDNTVGCWAAPALRHLMLVDGLEADEAMAKIEEFYGMIPDPSFSDRLMKNIGELLRPDGYTASHIKEGNLYQPRPDESTEIFAKVKARCQQVGFVFADPSTWDVLDSRKGCRFDLSEVDFSLTFGEKLAVKELGAAILKCDVASVYQAAHRIKAFVAKYPGKELPASLVPALCADLPINWFVASDGGSRCKKAEKFLTLLCSLGVIKKVRAKQWCGLGHPKNRATTYGLPQDKATSDLGRRWYYSCIMGLPAPQEREGESIYITDTSAFTDQDISEFVLEVERLNRPWKPQYHSSG